MQSNVADASIFVHCLRSLANINRCFWIILKSQKIPLLIANSKKLEWNLSDDLLRLYYPTNESSEIKFSVKDTFIYDFVKISLLNQFSETLLSTAIAKCSAKDENSFHRGEINFLSY